MDDNCPDTGPVQTLDAPGRWAMLEEAADALGVHERTLRRRIASGRYRVDRSAGRVLVWLPGSAPGRPDGHVDIARPDIAQTPGQPLPDSPDLSGQVPGHRPDTVAQALTFLERMLLDERARATFAEQRAVGLEQRASQAEQAAAMWQERARNLEAEVEHLLALPAHEEEPRRYWWQWWRR